jgi:small-conductance mechanosensitive channel
METANINIENAYKLITEKLEIWAETAIKMLPNLAIAILVVIVFAFVAKFAKKGGYKLFGKFTSSHPIKKLGGIFFYFLVLAIGVFIALSILKLDGTVVSLLAGVGVVGLALAFAFQEIAANYFSGILMGFQKPIKTGDLIKTNDYFGKVKEVHLRTTELTTLQGQTVLIPNAEVYKKPIENFSRTGRRRVDLKVGVSYSTDLERAKETALKAIKGIEGVKDTDVSLYFNEFGDSSINFTVRYWMPFTNKNFEYWDMVDKGVIAIKKAFDAADINIPFPIRTLDFGNLDVEKVFSRENPEEKE